MLVFALMLMAGGLIMAVSLIVFFAENLLPLLFAALAAKAAFVTGGGWPGALLAGSLTFALASTALRLSMLFITTPLLRLVLIGLIVVPAALFCFLLAEAVLWPFVPSSLWRTSLALIAALAAGAAAPRRLWTCAQQTGQAHWLPRGQPH